MQSTYQQRVARYAARVSATAWKNTTKRLYRVERAFSGRAALQRVKRFSTTPPRWAHRLESGAVWGACQTYDAVGRRASFTHAVAVRYVKRPLTKPPDAARQNSICVATPTRN